MNARPATPDRHNPDGTTTVTVKRACNACGRSLGDATTEELACAVAGLPLPEVDAECGCATPALPVTTIEGEPHEHVLPVQPDQWVDAPPDRRAAPGTETAGRAHGDRVNTAPQTELPRPHGYRGSGEPVWHADGATVSQTEPYNRADEDVPTVTLVGVRAGEWTLPHAQRLALAILAAVDWTSDTTPIEKARAIK